MSQIILYAAVSLDGYIAKNDGSIDWLPQEPDNDFGYEAFLGGIGSTIMGYNTYHQVLGFGDFPYKNKTNYVLTNRKNPVDNGYVDFVQEDAAVFVRALKKREEGDTWLIGGGRTNHYMLRHGLIDRLMLFVMPVSLGEGIGLFEGEAIEARWRTAHHRIHPDGTAELHYDAD